MRIALTLVVCACAGARAVPEKASATVPAQASATAPAQASATAPAQAPATPPAPRAWIDMRGTGTETLFNREATGLGEVAVGSADARFSGKTLALEPVTFVPNKKTESFTGKLTASETFDCTVRPERVFHADGMRVTLESLRKSLDVRAIVPVDVIAIAGGPLFLVDVVYLSGKGAETGVGEFKLAYFSRDGLSLICAHDGPGYRETFVGAVSLLAGTIRDDKAKPPLTVIFDAVSRLRIGPRVVGWSQVREFEPEADGSYQNEEYASMLFPGRAPPEYFARDTGRVERFDSSRALAHGSYELGKDSVWTDWKLLPRENLAYVVEGTEGEKPMNGVVLGHHGLRDISAAAELDVANARTKELLVDFYTLARPLQISELKIVRDAKVPRGVVFRISGVPDTSISLDEAGAPLTGMTPLGDGSIALTFERIWSSGKPR
ncbi:MAG: hypothetical protein ACJ78Z_05575 [Myxococcales bacterium]